MSTVPIGIPSPCVNVCQIDEASGLCRGCRRTLEEIATWLEMSDEERLRVWRRIAERRVARGEPLPGLLKDLSL